jgi:hypothetical protein
MGKHARRRCCVGVSTSAANFLFSIKLICRQMQDLKDDGRILQTPRTGSSWLRRRAPYRPRCRYGHHAWTGPHDCGDGLLISLVLQIHSICLHSLSDKTSHHPRTEFSIGKGRRFIGIRTNLMPADPAFDLDSICALTCGVFLRFSPQLVR